MAPRPKVGPKLETVGACQTRAWATSKPRPGFDRGSVSNPGLGFEVAHAQTSHAFAHDVIELVRVGAAADPGNPFATIHGAALAVAFDKRLIAGLLHRARDLSDGLVPGDVIPMV